MLLKADIFSFMVCPLERLQRLQKPLVWKNCWCTRFVVVCQELTIESGQGLVIKHWSLTLTLKFYAMLTALHFEEKTTMLTNAYLIFRCNSSALNSFTLLKK